MVRDELQIAREKLKAARGELWVVKVEQQADKEELQVARDELHLKTMTLSQVCQEVVVAESTMGRLDEECHGLHDDLLRKQALVSQNEGVIAELRDEACTLWASRWLAFRFKASKVFPGLSFNFRFPLRMRWENLTLMGRMALGCLRLPLTLLFFLATLWLRLPKLRLSILRLFPVILLWFGSLRLL